MSNIYLTLGDVTFQDFEVPEAVEFGGAQRVVVHELIGGGRTLDVLGGQPSKISFLGIFSGADASSRAQTLEAACAAGSSLDLGWDAFYYNVIITNFKANYKKPYWIPFAVECQAIANNAISTNVLPTPVTSLIDSDLVVAAQWSGAAGLGDENFTAPGALATQLSCDDQISRVGGQMLSNAVIFNNPETPFVAINALDSLNQNAVMLAAASYTNGYLSRAVANISLGAL